MNSKEWEWIDHIKDQMVEREITIEMVENALNKPDEVVTGKQKRVVYQKKIESKLLRVVTEGNRLITVYFTSKINKYMKGDKS
jgi:hypothetical protein